MREYETVFLTKPDLPDSDLKRIEDRVESVIKKHNGRLFFSRNMGRKNLAYSIKKQTKGVYTALDYAAGGGAVSELERSMKLDENVLRFITVVKNECVDVEARAAEVLARGEDVAIVPSEVAKEADVAKEKANDERAEQGEEE